MHGQTDIKTESIRRDGVPFPIHNEALPRPAEGIFPQDKNMTGRGIFRHPDREVKIGHSCYPSAEPGQLGAETGLTIQVRTRHVRINPTTYYVP